MYKDEFIDRVAAKAGISRAYAELAVDAVIQLIMDIMASGERLIITGFGIFGTKSRSPRVGRNPHTKEPIHIPARVVPDFKPSQYLKDLVAANNPTTDALHSSPMK